eukprot:g10677.t1
MPAPPTDDSVNSIKQTYGKVITEGRVSTFTMTVNLVAIGLGTGVLSEPWGLAGASLLVGVAINAFVLFLNGATIMLLVEACEKHKVFDLGRLVSLLPGRLGRGAPPFVNFLIGISSGGALVGASSRSERRCCVCLVFVCCRCVWWDHSWLSFTSSLSMAVNVNLLLILAVYLIGLGPHAGLCVLAFSPGVITLFSTLMYAMVVHMCIPPMYHEMAERTPANFRRCLVKAFSILFFVFSGFAGLGYGSFGPDVKSNVLLDLEQKSSWSALTRLSMILCCASIFPFLMLTLVVPFVPQEPVNRHQDMPGAESEKLRLLGEKSLNGKHEQGAGWTGVLCNTTTVTVAWMVFLVSCACFVTDLGYISVLNGAVGVAGMVGLIPALVAWNLLDGYRTTTVGRVSLCLLVAFCCSMCWLGFKFTDNHAEKLTASCWWRTS